MALLSDRLVRSAVLAVRPWLPRGVVNAMQKVDARIRKLNSRSAARPPLPPELRDQLKRDFAPEVERLSILLGRDLSYWSNDYGQGNAPSARVASGGPARAACANAAENLAA